MGLIADWVSGSVIKLFGKPFLGHLPVFSWRFKLFFEIGFALDSSLLLDCLLRQGLAQLVIRLFFGLVF